MNLGNNLFKARKRAGKSQEAVAEKLGVSRQTISKWETGETIPDIYQTKRLSELYGLSLDELVDIEPDQIDIERTIKNIDEKKEDKINWTSAWSKKYPVLASYRDRVDIRSYAGEIRDMLNRLKRDYGYGDLDSMLVLKDILYHEWQGK